MLLTEKRARAVNLGDLNFPTQDSCLGYFSDRLQSLDIGPIKDKELEQELKELIRRHPDSNAKMGNGVLGFEVVNSTSGPSRCFALRDSKGSLIEFSYRKCVRGKDVNQRALFTIACRNTVKSDILQAKSRLMTNGVGLCEITGQRLFCEELDADHCDPYQFSVIIEGFLRLENIDAQAPLTKRDGNGLVQFKDDGLKERFRQFHHRLADVRLIASKHNRSRSRQTIDRAKNPLHLVSHFSMDSCEVHSNNYGLSSKPVEKIANAEQEEVGSCE